MLRRAGVGVGAAVLAGLAMGAVARLMMRLVVLATGRETEFSWGGTVGILLAFVVFMVPGALLASLYRGRGRSLLLIAATLLLLVVATGVAVEDVGAVDDLSAAPLGGGGGRRARCLRGHPGAAGAHLPDPVPGSRDTRTTWSSGPRSAEHETESAPDGAQGGVRHGSAVRPDQLVDTIRGEHAHHQRLALGVLPPGVVEQPRTLLTAHHERAPARIRVTNASRPTGQPRSAGMAS